MTMIPRGALIGIGVGVGATGIATALALRHISQKRETEAQENTPAALADLIMQRHDRDGTAGVHLTGTATADDERAFPNTWGQDMGWEPGTTNGSYFRLLQAADLLGDQDKITQRDEVKALLNLADFDSSGVLEKREQQILTDGAGYSRSGTGVFRHQSTIDEVPAYNHVSQNLETAQWVYDQADADPKRAQLIVDRLRAYDTQRGS